jgi:sugar porter (SP) family MFS transporter
VIVMDDFRDTMGLPHPDYRGSDTTKTAFVLGAMVAMLSVGALVGSLVGGPLADRFGRKAVTLAGAATATVGGALQALSEGLVTMFVGRVVVGVGVGFLSVVVPLYNAEVAPSRLRGLLVSLQQLAITFGILVAFISNLGFASDNSWRGSLWLQTAASTALLVGGPFLPESPRWLVCKGQLDAALVVLRALRVYSTQDEVVAELSAIETTVAEAERMERAAQARPALGQSRAAQSFARCFGPSFAAGPRGGQRIGLGVGVMVLSQLTGINAVIYFSPTIFSSVGVGALEGTAVVGVVNFLSTFIAMGTIDHFGRKKLLIYGAVGMLLSLGGAAVLLLADSGDPVGPASNFTNNTPNSSNSGSGGRDVVVSAATGNMVTALVISYACCFAWSWGPVSWVFVSEIFPLAGRGIAVGLATGAMWLINTVLAMLTPPMLASSLGTPGTFLIYAGFVVTAGLFVLFLCPETKGQSLEGIDQLFAGEKRLLCAEARETFPDCSCLATCSGASRQAQYSNFERTPIISEFGSHDAGEDEV